MDSRFGAVEADFWRFYQLDVGAVYTGGLSPRRAGRLLYELPPDAAIFRGSDLDQRVLSQEALWLRVLVNIQLDEKDRVKFPSEVAAQVERQEAQIRKAEAMAARQRGGVVRER